MLKNIFNYPFLSKATTILYYKWRMKRCGSKTIINKPLYFTPKYVSMGDRVFVWKNARIEAVTGYV